jgi:hypothetical protein
VLAVVGGVIGAIWWAASALRENHNINKTSAFVISVATALQNKWKGAAWNTGGLISSCAEKAGLIPADFINKNGYDDCVAGYQNSVYPYRISHPWVNGNDQGVQIRTDPSNNRYIIAFIGLKSATVKEIISKVTASAGSGGELVAGYSVWGWGSSVPASSFPVQFKDVYTGTYQTASFNFFIPMR